MCRFWKRKSAVQEERGLPPAADLDLLARKEEAAFVASVLQKQQEREAPTALISRPNALEPEEIEWTDLEDVYRPQHMDASEFLAVMSPGPMPALHPDAACCFVRRPAFEKIQAHLRSNTRIELGGLLVGQALHDAERELYCVVVEEALPAYEGQSTAVSFAYTEATWQALSPLLQDLPPTWTLLGSYHSHPGMGVFLSATDLETQRGVFFHDWQIALVIDPISQAVGFFFGAEGHSCSFWYVV